MKCKICNREVKKLNSGMCYKHYNQVKKYGHVLDDNPRTRKDPNEIVIYEDHAEIVLYDNNCNETARALIDVEDVDLVKDYKWYLKNEGYIYSNKGATRLHRLVMNAQDKVIDHIDGNTLNNRKTNLRVCTVQQNGCNHKMSKKNTSGISGVYFSSKYNKWYAQITVNRKTISLGTYNTYEDAVQARKDAEDTYFGDFKRK